MPHEALKLIEILDIIEKTLELEPAGPNRKTLIAFIHAVRDEAKAEVESFKYKFLNWQIMVTFILILNY